MEQRHQYDLRHSWIILSTRDAFHKIVKLFCSSIFCDATAYTSNARQRSSFLLLLAKAGKHQNLLPLEINNGRVERVESPAAAWTFKIHI